MLKKIFYKGSLIAALFLLMNISSASAQIKLGLKAGFDVAENKINKNILNAHNRLGFQVGPVLQVGIPVVGLSVDAGLLYGYKKYDVKNEDIGDLSNYNYLTVPVHLKKNFAIVGNFVGIYVKGGPYAEIKLSGGDFKFNNISEKVKSKGFGMGLNFGVGVNLLTKLDVGIDYRFKLTDNYDNDTPGIKDYFTTRKDKTWNVNATYYF